MITFAYPKLLLLLLAVPVFIAIYAWARYCRKKNLRKFGKEINISGLMPMVSPYKPPVKLTVRMIALSAIILALARPWGGVSSTNSVKEGIEVVIAVDASNSMFASATEEIGGIDRMKMAKLCLERLIDRLDNDRVGLIVYAGDAYTLIPVTNDYASAKTFLNSIDPSALSHQGTNISAAVSLATASFSDSKDIGKAIILITDAEDLEDTQEVMASVKDASNKKIQVDVVGVGSTEPMPVEVNGQPLLDPDTGEPVKTSLNEDLAIDIAKVGKGIYVNAANKDAVSELEKQLDKLNKTALESSFLAVHDELFFIFVLIALAALITDLLILDRKIVTLDRFTFFKKEDK